MKKQNSKYTIFDVTICTITFGIFFYLIWIIINLIKGNTDLLNGILSIAVSLSIIIVLFAISQLSAKINCLSEQISELKNELDKEED